MIGEPEYFKDELFLQAEVGNDSLHEVLGLCLSLHDLFIDLMIVIKSVVFTLEFLVFLAVLVRTKWCSESAVTTDENVRVFIV